MLSIIMMRKRWLKLGHFHAKNEIEVVLMSQLTSAWGGGGNKTDTLYGVMSLCARMGV